MSSTSDGAGKQRLTGVAAIIVCVAALLCVYTLVVSVTGWMPSCPFKTLTGWECPGCGSQRALLALLHGHPLEAWRYNLLLPFFVAYVVLLAVLPRGNRLRRVLESLPAIWILLVCILAWWVLRNVL